MKTFYITMVELPTPINKLMTLVTKFKYTHFSISFNDKFDELYGFQILNKKSPFVGGLLVESEASYFHGKHNIYLDEIIFKIDVTDEEYQKVYEFVENVKNDDEYMFNYVSALFMLTLGGVKSYKAFHCVEFISEILALLNGIKLPKPAHKIFPKDLYELLKKFPCKQKRLYSEDFQMDNNSLFLSKIKVKPLVLKSLYSVREAICRAALQRTTKKFNSQYITYLKNDIRT